MAELSLRTVRALSAAAKLRRRQPRGTPGGGQFRPEMSSGGYRPPPFVMKQLDKAKDEKSFRAVGRKNGLDKKTLDGLWAERSGIAPPPPAPKTPAKKAIAAKPTTQKAVKVKTVSGTSRIVPPSDIPVGPRQIKDLEKMREEDREVYYTYRRSGSSHKAAVEGAQKARLDNVRAKRKYEEFTPAPIPGPAPIPTEPPPGRPRSYLSAKGKAVEGWSGDITQLVTANMQEGGIPATLFRSGLPRMQIRVTSAYTMLSRPGQLVVKFQYESNGVRDEQAVILKGDRQDPIIDFYEQDKIMRLHVKNPEPAKKESKKEAAERVDRILREILDGENRRKAIPDDDRTPVTLKRATPSAYRRSQALTPRWDFKPSDANSKYTDEIAWWKGRLAPLLADNAVIDINISTSLDSRLGHDKVVENYTTIIEAAEEFDRVFPGVMKELFGFFIPQQADSTNAAGLIGQVDLVHDDRNITSARSDGVYKHRTGLGVFYNGDVMGQAMNTSQGHIYGSSSHVSAQMLTEKNRIRAITFHELGHVLHAAAYVRIRDTNYYDAYAAWHGSKRTSYYRTLSFLQDKSFVDQDMLFDVMTGKNAAHLYGPTSPRKLPPVSEYGTKNVGEAIAETFAAIMMRDEDLFEYDWSKIVRNDFRNSGRYDITTMDDVRIEAAELFFEELYYNALPDRGGLANWRRSHDPSSTASPG